MFCSPEQIAKPIQFARAKKLSGENRKGVLGWSCNPKQAF